MDKREKEKRKSDHSRHFTIVFFLLAPSSPFSPYPYYVPLQVRSFPPLLARFWASFFFFPSLSVPWCQLVWCRCSWTPPLTDNSLDGTLLRTAQCTAILPVSTRFVVDGDDHPLHSEWYFPDGEGGWGGALREAFLNRVDCTMEVHAKLG